MRLIRFTIGKLNGVSKPPSLLAPKPDGRPPGDEGPSIKESLKEPSSPSPSLNEIQTDLGSPHPKSTPKRGMGILRRARAMRTQPRKVATKEGDWLNEELKKAAVEAAAKSETPVLSIRHNPAEPKALLVIKSQFYSVHATVSLTPEMSLHSRTVLDTGCGYNLIRADKLPPEVRNKLTKDGTLPNLGDANGNALGLVGSVALKVTLGRQTYAVSFLVASKLACDVLLGTMFLNRHCEAIRCRLGVVEFTRCRIPILDHEARVEDAEVAAENGKSSEELDRAKEKKKTSPLKSIRLSRPLTIPPMTQASATVTTGSHVLIVVQSFLAFTVVFVLPFGVAQKDTKRTEMS